MARFYAYLEPDPELVEAYVALVQTIKVYSAKGMPTQAAQARAAYQRMLRDYELLSRRGAAKADIFIRDRLRQTAVRPPTSGRLAAAVQSVPMSGVAAAGGGVAIASIRKLDTLAVDPRFKDSGAYWRAQEYGTDAHVGRVVPGYFMPGRSAPSAGEFRNHPYFEQAGRGIGGKAPKGTPAMVITRPLHARHFLRDGTAAFAVWHALQTTRINTDAILGLP